MMQSVSVSGILFSPLSAGFRIITQFVLNVLSKFVSSSTCSWKRISKCRARGWWQERGQEVILWVTHNTRHVCRNVCHCNKKTNIRRAVLLKNKNHMYCSWDLYWCKRAVKYVSEFEFFPKNVSEFDFCQKLSAKSRFSKSNSVNDDVLDSLWRVSELLTVWKMRPCLWCSLSFRADRACLLCAYVRRVD